MHEIHMFLVQQIILFEIDNYGFTNRFDGQVILVTLINKNTTQYGSAFSTAYISGMGIKRRERQLLYRNFKSLMRRE